MAFDLEHNPFQDTGLTPDIVQAIMDSNRSKPEALGVALSGLKRLVGRAFHPDATLAAEDEHFTRIVTAIDTLLELSPDDTFAMAKEFTLKKRPKKPKNEKKVETVTAAEPAEVISFVQGLDFESFAPLTPAGTEITVQGGMMEANQPLRLVITKTAKTEEVEVERETYQPFNELEAITIMDILATNEAAIDAWAQAGSKQSSGYLSNSFYARLTADNRLEIRGANRSLFLTMPPAPHLRPDTNYALKMLRDNDCFTLDLGNYKWAKTGVKETHTVRLLGSLKPEFVSELRRKVARNMMGDKAIMVEPNVFGASQTLLTAARPLPAGKMGLGGGWLTDPVEKKFAEQFYIPKLLPNHYLLISSEGSLRVIGLINHIFLPRQNPETENQNA